jgi:proline iminopeptidase
MPHIRSCFTGPSIAFLLFAAPTSISAQIPRESILDRKARFEKSLVQNVPQVPRLCDTLGMKGRKVDIGGCRLYMEEEGHGVPLVLINGGPGGTHHGFHPWFHQAAGFAHVIYYDQRGCGLSDWEPGPGYTVEQAMEDLEALRKQLGYERWTVLGWSYGGFLAQLYAIRYPERTAGLVLVGASTGLDSDFGSREDTFLSKEEQDHFDDVRCALREINKREQMDHQSFTALSIFNMMLNGNWKRQAFYRPTREEAARTARYEWNNPQEFNGDLSQSMNRYDLAGAFIGYPAPTLIMEGRWDLTWGEQKPQALLANHPGAGMKVFDRSAHAIFSEEPEAFFFTLRQFMTGLPKDVDPARLVSYQNRVARWREQMAHPVFPIHWGAVASKAICMAPEAWLKDHPGDKGLLRLGFAYYDGKAFAPALECFYKLETLAQQRKDSATELLAVLWEGHLLDLLNRRQEALCCYQRVKDAGKSFRFSSDQYGLHFNSVDYPGTRLKEPFTFHPNQIQD